METTIAPMELYYLQQYFVYVIVDFTVKVT